MTMEVKKVSDDLVIEITSPLDKQVLYVSTTAWGFCIKSVLRTGTYSVNVDAGHLSDLIAALQEIRNKSNEPVKRGSP